jgi:hypothetical protein
MICSPIELDTDGAILLRQDGRASWASFHGSRTVDASSPWSSKRGVVQQLLKGEKTLAQVSRELDIQPSVVRQWKRRFEAGATAAVATNEDVVPVRSSRGRPRPGP